MNRMTEPAARPGTAQFCALLAATATAPCAAADALPASALDSPSPVLPLAILALLLVALVWWSQGRRMNGQPMRRAGGASLNAG